MVIRSAVIAVFNMSKIQTWKRITTFHNLFKYVVLLYLICQRYKLESESQPPNLCARLWSAVFNMSKIQTWKRITTPYAEPFLVGLLYLICQRYKLESESQPVFPDIRQVLAVFNMSKIQTWKRITTVGGLWILVEELYLICQRYKLESESQRKPQDNINGRSCI